MPQVPTIGGPRVATAPLPQVRAPLETFGGGSADHVPDLSGLLDTALAIHADQTRKANQLAVQDAGAKIVDAGTSLELEAQQRLGKDAFGAIDDAKAKFDKANGEIESGLKTDEARLAYRNIAQSRWNTLNQVVQHHVAQQHKVYDTETTNGLLLGLADSTVQNFQHPDVVALNIAQMTGAIRDAGQRNGEPAELIAAHVAENTSKMHVAVIDRMLANVGDGEQPRQAQAYYDAHKGEIVGPQAAQVDSLLARKSVEGTSQQQADAIAAKSPDLTDALKQAALITDPHVRTLTEERLRRHFADVATADRERKQQNYQQASAILEQTRDFSKVPLAVRMKLSPGENEALQHREDQLRHPKEGPGDPDKFLQLMNESYFNPSSFDSTNLLAVPGLNRAQREDLMRLQRTVGTRDTQHDVTELQRDVTRAESDVRYYQRHVETATAAGDDDAKALYQKRQFEAATELTRASTALDARKKVSPMKTPATPQMLEDVAKKGPAYAAYLRMMGIDVPAVVPKSPKP